MTVNNEILLDDAGHHHSLALAATQLAGRQRPPNPAQYDRDGRAVQGDHHHAAVLMRRHGTYLRTADAIHCPADYRFTRPSATVSYGSFAGVTIDTPKPLGRESPNPCCSPSSPSHTSLKLFFVEEEATRAERIRCWVMETQGNAQNNWAGTGPSKTHRPSSTWTRAPSVG